MLRPTRIAVFLMIGAAVALSSWVAAQTKAAVYTIATDAEDSRHRDIEVLFSRGDYRGERRLAEARLKKTPDDPELYIHLFRAMFEEGEAHPRDDKSFDKAAHYEKMLELIERALKLAPNHPRLLWGKAIALARSGTTRGVLASLFMAKELESTWLKVVESGYRYQSFNQLEVLPCDAQLALGIFYRLVPDWWIVKVIAGTRGDLDKSLRYLHASEKCSPGRIRSKKETGVAELCYAERNDDKAARARGRALLTAATKMDAPREIDRIDVKHSASLLNNPEAACGYSRDGHQSLDKSELNKNAK